MKLDKFFKLQSELETFGFEKNFKSLSRTLYYFSFLGNIFLILFSYFFIKDVTNSVPVLFSKQGLFFSVFTILFMTGYELFKRFAFERLMSGILKAKKVTKNIVLGVLICSALISGSFYLSLNGAHRLIDTTNIVQSTTDSVVTNQTDSIAKYYNNEILFYRSQPARSKTDRRYRDSIVAVLQKSKDDKITAIETKMATKTTVKLDEVKQNSIAFAIMVFFLEFIILIGVSFNAYYVWMSYSEMKQVLSTPRYRQLELNSNLLKLYYQNGRKKEKDYVIAGSKMITLAKAIKLNVTQTDIDNFLTLCSELEITIGNGVNKTYNMSYDDAKTLIEINPED
jgi:hypothetical protein